MDELYIKKVLNGDREAFRYFIRSYQEMAYAIAISLVKEEDRAKEIVQESFIQAYTSLSSFRQDAKFSSWLYKIVVNKGLKYVSRQQKWAKMVQVEEVIESDQYQYNEALEKLEREELRRLIRLILQEIPPKEAIVLKLFYLEEYKMKEVEEITGFSKSNVKVLLHRGRNRFYQLSQAERIQTQFKDLIHKHEGRR